MLKVYHKVNGTPELKMKGAKEIVFAMLKAKGADLQAHSAIDQTVYREIAADLLKRADSGTYPLSFPPTRSLNPEPQA